MFFGQSPKNNDIRLRRAKALRSESFVFPSFFFVFPSFPERVARRENGLCLLSLRQNKKSSFPGYAPGKDTLRAANAATKERFTGRKQNKRERILLSSRRSPKVGANGGKREGERSERESVVPRQNKDSRRVGGHAPPQRHLKRSAATTKEGANGGENNRTSHAK